MKETKDNLFKEWSSVDGFTGCGIGKDCIMMYWKDIIPGNAPSEKDGYRIEHEVIGEIKTQ